MKLSKTLTALALAGAAFSAQAHKPWLLPSSSLVDSKEPWVTVDAAISEGLFDIDHQKSSLLEEQVHESLARKAPGAPDSETVLRIKALIRWAEAKAAALACGCREQNLHFLDLPFYRTGTISKKPMGDEDVRIIRELIQRVDPSQVYVAGDLSDPHGTHRMCKEAIDRALAAHLSAGGKRPEVWLYRGAWQEWPVTDATWLVPLSQEELRLKVQAIFKHQSQKDTAPFPGPDEREFWQRVEARNKGTAAELDRLGLAEYFAMEAYVVEAVGR